jgi:hypothetical protein
VRQGDVDAPRLFVDLHIGAGLEIHAREQPRRDHDERLLGRPIPRVAVDENIPNRGLDRHQLRHVPHPVHDELVRDRGGVLPAGEKSADRRALLKPDAEDERRGRDGKEPGTKMNKE